MGSCVSCCSKESDTNTLVNTSSPDSPAQNSVEEAPPTFNENVAAENTDTAAVDKMSPVSDPPQVDQNHVSLVNIVYSPATEANPCPYCSSPEGDLHDFFHVIFSMPCELYEEFIETGWWRTGKIVFRPRFDVVCCPGYSMRLPVEEYVLNKKHRRVIRKWGDFLRNGHAEWDKTEVTVSAQKAEETAKKRAKGPVTPGAGPDPNKPLCKKAKERRAERVKAEQQSAPKIPDPSSSVSLIELIGTNIFPQDCLTGLKHSFEAKLVPCSPTDPLLAATSHRAYELYDKLQEVVHPGKTRFESEDQFVQGFCSSCMPITTSPPQGSFLLQYYLDHELVMYSIVDITPHYFVSVYFVYDPELRFLSPGIFTCLYEIALVQKLRKTMANLRYYGLGYYNHFDDKALYKKQFKPQQVLCNETNVFVSLESAIPKFLEKKYCRLVDDSVPEKEGRNASIDEVTVSFRLLSMGPFSTLVEKKKEKYRPSLKQFVTEAGSSAAHKCNVDLLENFND